MATSTVVADHRKSKKFVLVLDSILKIMMTFWNACGIGMNFSSQIRWEFQKECFPLLSVSSRDISNVKSSSVDGAKLQNNHQNAGDDKRIKGKIQQLISQTLQPIFNELGHKLKLSTLLQHTSTNENELLGPDVRRACAKVLFLGCY